MGSAVVSDSGVGSGVDSGVGSVGVCSSGVDLGGGALSVDGWAWGREMGASVGWTSGVCFVVVSSSILLVLGFVVSEMSPPVVVWFTFTLTFPVLISAVVVYSSVRGVSPVADPLSVGFSPLYSPL